ncbi:sugar isomerase domain-containing protein [Allostreptomyces psammosilenae]|uniref:Putative phosphosugar-binding protein n=1 Tax=Allostreptomyces psammosilenae TaxID=1892865 RepID=A0A853AB62_9ACTN|nr:SIS domain-containing protein [Allostreptomyces psammosilenae]NYI07738.1 putative phosphosugar-binding protein [Allostreptomyces psammosilenae]
MTELAGQYLDAALEALRRARDDAAPAVDAVAGAVARTVADGGRLFVFGAGHSSLPAMDVVYRAGGLALMNLLAVPGVTGVDVVPATLGSALEHVPGLATATLDCSPARTGDLLFVISLSGRNTLPVEMASQARGRGLTVVGVTSLAYAAEVSSRHPSGTFLKDHCDLVLDTGIGVGDAELEVDGVPGRIGPVSTVVTSALLQAVVAGAIGLLVERGVTPPTFRSGNVDGGTEWNRTVLADNADRIFHSYPPTAHR